MRPFFNFGIRVKAHTIEELPDGSGVGVDKSGRSGLTGDIGRQRCENR